MNGKSQDFITFKVQIAELGWDILLLQFCHSTINSFRCFFNRNEIL